MAPLLWRGPVPRAGRGPPGASSSPSRGPYRRKVTPCAQSSWPPWEWAPVRCVTSPWPSSSGRDGRTAPDGRSPRVLLALTIWNLAYAAELLTLDPANSLAWGDLKYVGIGALVPAWLAFVLCWTGARPPGHPPAGGAADDRAPAAARRARASPPPTTWSATSTRRTSSTGPRSSCRRAPCSGSTCPTSTCSCSARPAPSSSRCCGASRAYGLQAAVLTGAALLPWVTNLGYNFDIDPLAEVDLTPAAFTLSAAILAWGMFRQHLLRLAPVAYRQIVAGMSDAVFLLDMFGHLVETNPAAEAMLEPGPGPGGRHRRRMVLPEGLAPWAVGDGPGEVSLEVEGATHDYEVQAERAAGPPRPAQGAVAHPARHHRPAPARARGGPAARGPVPDRRHPQPLAASRRPARARGRAGWPRPTARPGWGTRSAVTSTTSTPRAPPGPSRSATSAARARRRRP